MGRRSRNKQRRQHRKVAESTRVNGVELVRRLDYLPTEYGFGEFGLLPGIGYPAPYPTSPNDRFQGADWPAITNQQDVDAARALARYVTAVNCPAIGIGENLKNYVIGKGFTFSAGTKKNAAAPAGLVDAVQYVVDEFLDLNDFIGDLDRELFWRSRRDGEFFLAMYPRGDGITSLRVIEPEQVTAPAGVPWYDSDLSKQFKLNIDVATNWEFGIHKADHDVQTVFGYHIEWSHGDISYMPAHSVEHHKVNVDRNVARGMTDFFPAWKWLEQQARVLTNTGEGAAELAAISYIIQHVEGVTNQQVMSMRAALADFTSQVNGKTLYHEHKPPGSKLDVPRGQEYLPGPMGAERGQAFLAVVQGILRQVATRWCLSEGQVSGDDSNNNFASSVTAGSRFHRYAIASQARIGRSFNRIVWKALEHAHNAGRFSRFRLSWPEFMRLVEVNIEPPAVDEQGKLEQEQIREIRRRNGVLSLKTWRTEAGIDHDQEVANLQEEQPQRPAPLPAAESLARVRKLISEAYP